MTDGHCTLHSNEGSGNVFDGCTANDCSEESVDPRVQVELERLNAATDIINKLEVELDEARSNFRLLLSESSQRVNYLAKTLGSCVEKARPYYEARMKAKQLQARTQKAALRYERASSAHAASKEMVYLAEEGLKKQGKCFDPAWQEMLNHATMRVNESESERILSQRDHQQTSSAYNETEKIVQQLHQEIKRAIVKSSLSTRRSLLQLNILANQHQLQLLPYFEMKARFNQLLDEQRQKVHRLEENVLKVKLSYADALHNLEEISDEIHQRRQHDDELRPSQRSEGVGAESPDTFGNSYSRSRYDHGVRRSISSEDLFNDDYSVEDNYKSLPTKFDPRVSLFAGSSHEVLKGCQRENSLPGINIRLNELHKHGKASAIQSDICYSQCIEAVHNDGVGNSSKLSYSLATHKDGVCSTTVVENHLKKLSVSAENPTGDTFESLSHQIDRLPEGSEIPNQKHHAIDMNILRVQREDLSDSESLASNDTTDTLDDNQIECLLLDRVLSREYDDAFSLANSPCENNE